MTAHPRPQPQAVRPARTNYPAAPLGWRQYARMVQRGQITPHDPARHPAPQCACSSTVHQCRTEDQ